MYFLKFTVVLIISMTCQFAHANDAEDIVSEMTANNPEGITQKREKFQGIAKEQGIVRKEIIFLYNGNKYTIWDIDIYNGDDLLRVYFSDANCKSDDCKGSYDLNSKTGEIVVLYSNNYSYNYDPRFVGTDSYKMPQQEAKDIVALHTNNIFMFLGLE